MIRFKNVTCNVGKVPSYSIRGKEKVPAKYKISWEFITNVPDITMEVEETVPSCSCTASLEYSDLTPIPGTKLYSGTLHGVYTSEIGAKKFNKNVILWLNDGVVKTKKNALGGYELNPDKGYHSLVITGEHVI